MKVAAPKSINCPNCGGNIQLRGFEHTRCAVCVQCLSIIDPTTPELKIVQKFDERLRVQPLIPLGKRGKMHGAPYEVIGFQVRTITVEGTEYSWHEYLLFNPYKGFRYLTQYDGHWNDVIPVKGLPAFKQEGGRPAVSYLGNTYKHFQRSVAETTFVMGEFPWAVRVGERVEVDDFVCPPEMLSLEKNEGEINWSIGAYADGAQIWRAFEMQGAPPAARGVYANQPSPHGSKVRQIWGTFLKLALVWAALIAWFTFAAGNKEVYRHSYHFSQADPGEHSFVTDVFELEGRRSNVEVELKTDLDNNWAYFNLALLREDGAYGFDFGREVSYYRGRDADGSWTEGAARDTAIVPSVPGGKYYMRIEPEMDAQASAQATAGQTMNYEIVVRRDVPRSSLFWLVLPFLLIPPIFSTFRSVSFESRRWQESDYAPSGGDE